MILEIRLFFNRLLWKSSMFRQKNALWVSPKPSPSLPKGFPRDSPRLPKGSQSLLLSSCFFLILASIPFVNNTNCTADIRIGLPIVWPILRSLCWVLGCSESDFSSKNSPNCVRYLPGGIAKNAIFSSSFFAISLHMFALRTSFMLQICPCIRRNLFVFFRLLLRCGVFGITFFATKNSPNQPKLCEVPRFWNHKKHVLFARASDFSPHVLPKNIVWVAELSFWTPIRVFFRPMSLHAFSLSWRPLFWFLRMFHTF